jgi:hypothetical protein
MTNPFLDELDQETGNPFLDELRPKKPPVSTTGALAQPPAKPSKTSLFSEFIAGGINAATRSASVSGKAVGDFGSGLKTGAVEGGQDLLNTFNKLSPYSQLVSSAKGQTRTKDIFNTEARVPSASSAESAGRFVGSFAPGLAVSIPTAGVVNPLIGPLQARVLGGVASKVAGSFAKSAAMKAAVEVGITTIPQELVAGAISEAILHPESFDSWKSVGRTLALSSIGSIFNMGFAYSGAIKKAKSFAELENIRNQLKELTPEDVYRPSAPPEVKFGHLIDKGASNTTMPTAVEAARARVFDKELPTSGQFPTANEAAWRRMTESLNEQTEARAAALADIKPPKVKDRLADAAARQTETDPLVLAQLNRVESRLLELSGAGGKQMQTGPGVDLGVTLSPNQFLTIEELTGHLQVLNMASISAQPEFKAGQRFVLGRTIPTAEEITGRVTGGPIRKIDKTIQAGMKDVQARLDDAASRGIGTFDPEETQTLVSEILSMSRRLSRGFEVPRSANKPQLGPERAATLRYVEGFDLPTAVKLGDDDVAEQVSDNTFKRWVTGSDEAVPNPVTGVIEPPPIVPPEIGAVVAKTYAEAVGGMNIDYTPKSKSIFDNVVDWTKNIKQELYDRNWGVAKYDKEAGNRLSLLAGTARYAEDFYSKEMRLPVLEADGTWKGKTQAVEGRPLEAIINNLKMDEIQELDAVLKAMTLADQVKKDPNFILDVDKSTYENVIQNAPAHVKALANEFRVVANTLVNDAVTLGRISVDKGVELRESFYAGLSRSMNNAAPQKAGLARVGSKKQSLSPVMLMRDNTFKMLEATRKNYAFSRLIDAYDTNPAKFADVLAPSGIEAKLENIPDFVKLRDEFVTDGMTHKEATDLAALMQTGKDATDGSLVVFRDGRPTFWKVNNDIRRTMEALNPVEFNLFRSIMAATSVPVRTTTSLALDLSGIGPVSDAILTASKVPQFNPIIDPIRGAWHSMLRTPEYMERVAAGGSYGGRFQPAEAVVFQNATGVPKVLKQIVRPFDFLQALIRPLSDASRMGEYLVRTQKLHQDPLTAALGSRQTLGDFNQVGASMRAWSLMTEFGNVGIQTAGAAAELLRDAGKAALKGDIRPMIRLNAAGVAAITIPTLLFRHLSQDDDVLEAQRKSDSGYRYWWFRLPHDVPVIGKKGDIVKYPKIGWWMGQMYGSTVEAALDGMDVDARRRLLDGVVGQVGLNPMPLKVQQLYGFMTNTRNPLSPGESIPITPRGQEGLDPSVMGNERTSPLARSIADRFGINPFKTDYLVESAGGTVFGSAVRSFGKNSVKLEKSDIPVFGRFYTRAGAPTEGQSAFYRDMREATNFEKSYQRAKDAGDADKMRKILEEANPLLQNKDIMENTAEKVSSANKWISTITLDQTLSPEGKREMINNLREYQATIFRGYVGYHEAVKENDKK